MRWDKKHDTEWQECPECIKKYYPETWSISSKIYPHKWFKSFWTHNL